MKNLIFISFFSLLLFSCSDSDDGEVTEPTTMVDYLPTTDSATWHYNYSQENLDQVSNGDFWVRMGTSSTIDNVEYKILNNTLLMIGVMDQIFFNKLHTNEITIRPRFEISGYSADMGDLLFIKSSMSEGQLVSEKTTEITAETTEIPSNENGISGTVTPKIFITIKNYHVNKPETLIVNNTTFNELTHQELKFEIRVVLDIDIQSPLPIPLEHELISNQEYGELDMWLAKDVGIVKSEYDYSFEDLEVNTTISAGALEVNLTDIAPEISLFNNAVNLVGESLIVDYSL